MRALAVLLLMFIAYTGNTQGVITLGGAIQDSVTKEPLDFVSIGIIGSNMYTFSNDEGQFTFHIPEALSGDSIRFSHLGYQSTTRSIQSLINTQSALLLKPVSIELPEVVVTDNARKLADQIVAKAVARIPLNYPKDDFILEGYWRISQTVDDGYVSYLDASVEIYDSLFTTDPKTKWKTLEQLHVKGVRASDYLNPKGYLNWWDSVIFKRYNYLGQLLRNNDIRNQRGVFLKENTYELAGMVSFNDELCYRIMVTHKPSKKPVTFETELIISEKDYKIYRIIKGEKGEEGNRKSYSFYRKTSPNVIAGINGYSYNFEFKEYHGKLYLSSAKGSWILEDYNIKTRSVEHVNVYAQELYVNKIREDVSLKDKKPFAAGKGASNFEIMKIPYAPDFWKTYNFVPFNKDIKKAFADLSVKTPIESQFSNFNRK